MGEDERSISIVKYHVRGIITTLLYACLPSQITIHLVYFVLMWLNSVPARNVVSKKYSLRDIFTGSHPDFNRHCKVLFGSYLEAHDDPMVAKNMTPRTHSCISLGPTINI